jgi:HEAT repeat protein
MNALVLLLAFAGSVEGERIAPAVDPSATRPARAIAAAMPDPATIAPSPGALQDPVVLAKLRRDLEAEDAAVREGALEQLVRGDAKSVVPIARAALVSDREATRVLGVKILRRLTAKGVHRDLERVVDRDRSDTVRREACHALIDCAPKDAPAILLVVAREDTSTAVRRAAINDLGRLASLEAAESLVQVLADVLAEGDEYLVKQTTLALTLATDKLHGENVEGWRHHVAKMRADAEAKAGLAEAEAGEFASREVVIEPITYVPPTGSN